LWNWMIAASGDAPSGLLITWTEKINCPNACWKGDANL
jgi:hypothetical protein